MSSRKSKKNGLMGSCPAQIDFLDLLDAEPVLPHKSDCPQIPMEGFSALPVGNYNGGFNNVGSNANFWSASENNNNNANNWNLNASNANLNNNNKNNGFAVRCFQDSGEFSGFDLHSELVRAYYEARRHKRNTANQLNFEKNLAENLVQLADELKCYEYRLRPSVCFINEKPVKREIIAADFRDRVVHHLLYNWIYPIFDRQFIYDSYSCRIGKGTLFGIKRAARFIKSESQNFTEPCYVLRLDVSGFFMSVNREILYKLCVKGLKRAKWRGVSSRELCVYLLKIFIFSDPLKNAIFRSAPEKWVGLPANKSLLKTSGNCGLPIGNLTSQLFGNVYMNPLDYFVKQSLGIRCYGRYVDDMYFVHRDRKVLLEVVDRVRQFLRDRLHLTLHPHKVYLQSVNHGFAFLGAYILPNRIYAGRRLVKNAIYCVKNPVQPKWRQQNRIVSYNGFLKHYDCFALKRKLNVFFEQ